MAPMAELWVVAAGFWHSRVPLEVLEPYNASLSHSHPRSVPLAFATTLTPAL